MDKITLDLEFSKVTRGAVMYELPDRTGLPFRKKGFPAKIRVTVEVLD